MDEILKKLVKDNVLTEDTMNSVKESFDKALSEAKQEQEKQIRAELSERYEEDKKAISSAMEEFLEQEVKEHVAELREGVKQVEDMKAKLAEERSKVREKAKQEVLKIKTILETAVGETLEKEIKELHESEVQNRKAYANAVADAKAKLAEEKKAFREKGAVVLENIINTRLNNQLDELREDIVAANKANFGRELYEAFATTFRRQFFNSNKEMKDLVSKLQEAEQARERVEKNAKKKVTEAEKKAQAALQSRKKLEENYIRKNKINKLLEKFSGQSREKMKYLLESSKTSELDKTFRKYAPSILNESKKQNTPKKKLEETVVQLETGGTEPAPAQDNYDDEIESIRRRSGYGA